MENGGKVALETLPTLLLIMMSLECNQVSYFKIQLTLEQYGSELHKSTNRWVPHPNLEFPKVISWLKM